MIHISHRLFTVDHLCFLERKLPALTLGTVPAPISTAAAHSQLRISTKVQIRLTGTAGCVLELLRSVFINCVHTLHEKL